TKATPEEVVAAAAEAVKPSAQTISFHLIDAYLGDRHVRVTCKTSPVPQWGLGGSVISTSAPAAAAVRLLAKGKITARGAIPPEAAMQPQDMFDELASRNAVFSVTEYEPGGVQ
ncbi:MAG: hypothetical protein ACRDKE_02680, partial [Solirubrobacterales bacterium]